MLRTAKLLIPLLLVSLGCLLGVASTNLHAQAQFLSCDMINGCSGGAACANVRSVNGCDMLCKDGPVVLCNVD